MSSFLSARSSFSSFSIVFLRESIIRSLRWISCWLMPGAKASLTFELSSLISFSRYLILIYLFSSYLSFNLSSLFKSSISNSQFSLMLILQDRSAISLYLSANWFFNLYACPLKFDISLCFSLKSFSNSTTLLFLIL